MSGPSRASIVVWSVAALFVAGVVAARAVLPADADPAEREDWIAQRLMMRERANTMHTRVGADGRRVHAIGRHTCDGVEVVRQVQAAHYDLVLMDIQMPLMDGLVATRAIRGLSGEVGAIPIVAMTANAMIEDRQACAAVGMDDGVVKPIDPQELAAAIERASGATKDGV